LKGLTQKASTFWIVMEHVNTIKMNMPTQNAEQKRAILLVAWLRVETTSTFLWFSVLLFISSQNVASSAHKNPLQKSIDLNVIHMKIFFLFD
jgi:hypothetical protein